MTGRTETWGVKTAVVVRRVVIGVVLDPFVVDGLIRVGGRGRWSRLI